MKTKKHIEYIIIFALCVASFTVHSKEILSGVDIFKNKVYFNDESIQSFGNIVIGETYSDISQEFINEYYRETKKILLICKTSELITASSEKVYTDSKKNYMKSEKENINEDTGPIAMNDDAQLTKFLGLGGLQSALKAKCNKTTKKYPRYYIPLARSDTRLVSIILDTITTRANGIKVAWGIMRDLESEPYKTQDGTVLKKSDGEELKKYKLKYKNKNDLLEYNIDCNKNTIQITRQISYKENKEVDKSGSVDVPFNINSMESIIPESFGELFASFICIL